MNFLVTGGLGRIGCEAAAHLLSKGHNVRITDTLASAEIPDEIRAKIAGAAYQQVDVRDFAAVRESCQGMDGVVHMAGIPFPLFSKSAEIYHINAGGTFNVYQAAADAGIKRVVAASSINWLGNGFGKKLIDVQYFPVDEAHPGFATDVYAFSKQILEETAVYFWRHARISSISLRFPWVMNTGWFGEEQALDHLQACREAYDSLLMLPQDQRREQAQALLNQYLEIRQRRQRDEIQYQDIFQFFVTVPGARLLFGVDNFWSILDNRDAATVIEQALLAEFDGAHSVFVADPYTLTGLPSREMAALFYPNVKTWHRQIQGAQTLLNTERAQGLFDFAPQYSIKRLYD